MQMENTGTQCREPRRAMEGVLRYSADGSDAGAAQWLDVSRVGAGMRLGRYLRPGRLVRLRFASPLAAGKEETLTARVIWCQPASDGPDFFAGVQVRRDAPRAALAFSMLGEGREPAPATEAKSVRGGVWPHFTACEATEQEKQVQAAAMHWQPA